MIEKILGRCSEIGIDELRENTGDYLEFVIFSRDFDKWKELFDSIFGKPLKDKGVKPSGCNIKITRPYGGIRANQVLYEKDGFILMVWPWQNGELETVKVIKNDK